MRQPLAYIFDLDGTLIDSLQDIAESINFGLDLLGVPPRRVEDYRYLVGEGVPTLCQRIVGSSHPHYVKRLADLGRAEYRARPLRHTRPYDGIHDLIGRLKARGVKLAALSNKPHELTRLCVDAFWPGGEFERVYGYVEENLRKPSPHYVLRICDELGVHPSDTCLIGDTPTDVETARNAGAACIAVTWGFRTRADLTASGATRIIDRPDEIA